LIIVDKNRKVYIYSSEENYIAGLTEAIADKNMIKNLYTKDSVSSTLLKFIYL
jgi:hypothetical protein